VEAGARVYYATSYVVDEGPSAKLRMSGVLFQLGVTYH
jgi:hypothetical protein